MISLFVFFQFQKLYIFTFSMAWKQTAPGNTHAKNFLQNGLMGCTLTWGNGHAVILSYKNKCEWCARTSKDIYCSLEGKICLFWFVKEGKSIFIAFWF